MIKLHIPCRILDKRKKDGWFGMKYFLTIELLLRSEDKRSPITATTDKVMDIRCDDDAFYRIKVGELQLVSFAKDEESGKWSVYRPG
jgi:hypothetical protein